MKKFYLIMLAVIALCGCSTSRYTETTYLLDFRKYVKEGFVINPNSSGLEYTPLGSLEVRFEEGKKLEGEYKNIIGLKVRKDTNRNVVYGYYPSSERMIEKIVEECKKLGANGIVDFRIKYVPSESNKPYWKAEGLAVKINK